MKPDFKQFFGSVAGLSLLFLVCCSSGNYSYDNLTKNNDDSKSKPIINVVKKIESLMKTENWKGIYEITAPDLKKQFSVDKCSAQFEQLTKRYGVVDTLDIKEIHLAKKSGDFRAPIKGESIILPNPIELFPPESGTLSFILCETKSIETHFSCWLTLVLKNENNNWFLSSFYMTPSEVNGHNGDWFLKKAEEFSQKSEARNSYLYTLIGYQILHTGPFISSPSVVKGYNDFLAKPAPPNLPFEGVRPSEIWKTETGGIQVDYVGHVGASKLLNLEIRYKSALNDLESKGATAERKAVFDYTLKTFPEYKHAFGGIYIGSMSPVGAGFREFFKFTE